MKEGSLIVFEQITSGFEIVGKQRALFPSAVVIEPGMSGLICKIQKADFGKMILAEILIGNSLICDVDLSDTTFYTVG
tara:strand:+ start:146 stop:379 length:234 start_codon:yes stop_codon:yes gene_type:complete